MSPGKAKYFQTLAFAPDGEGIVLACGRYLQRWDLVAGVVEERWRRGANDCRCVAFTADGWLAVACYPLHGYIDRYRVDLFPSDPAAKKTFLPGDYGAPSAMAFSADGRFLIAGSENRTIRVWRLAGERASWSWECRFRPWAVVLSPDGAVAVTSVGTVLTAYNALTREPLRELTGHADGNVRALAFAPDGTLLSGGDDGIARLWDVDTGQEIAAFDWNVGAIDTAAFSPDGSLAAVGGANGLVVWDVG